MSTQDESEEDKDVLRPNQANRPKPKRSYSWLPRGAGGILMCEGVEVFHAQSFAEAIDWLDERQAQEEAP